MDLLSFSAGGGSGSWAVSLMTQMFFSHSGVTAFFTVLLGTGWVDCISVLCMYTVHTVAYCAIYVESVHGLKGPCDVYMHMPTLYGTYVIIII